MGSAHWTSGMGGMEVGAEVGGEGVEWHATDYR